MPNKSKSSVSVIIPNWNGKDSLGNCIDSLNLQTHEAHIIVVENNSKDGSLEFLQKYYPNVEVIVNKKNKGFAGGVNTGIRRSIEINDSYILLFNNDAVADKDLISKLVGFLNQHDDFGIVTCKLIKSKDGHLDSTGEMYSVWGLPYPRGRNESTTSMYDNLKEVFGASGGASLYRVSMLKKIGLFDENFFAYYEDVDICFRAQLTKFKVGYEPSAIAWHTIGATSSKIKGFTTYQTMKNLYPS